jgi:hypothetical protein
MCSERPTAARLGALLALLLALLGSGCGRKEDPKPPPSKIPARTNDLEVTQQGMDLVLTMSYPTATAGGLALAGIDRVEFLRYTRAAPELTARTVEQPPAGVPAEEEPAEEAGAPPEPGVTEPEAPEPEAPGPTTPAAEGEAVEEAVEPGAEPPEAPAAPNPYLQIAVDPELFTKSAEQFLVLVGEALEQSVVGGSIVVRVPVEEITTDPPTAYTFTAQTFAGRLRSPISRFASFAPLPPPEPPRDIRVAPEAQGVRLSWSEPEGDVGIEGYRIFRKSPQATQYGSPIATLEAGETEHLDRNATFGNRYVYAITTLAMRRPVVESRLGGETEVRFVDEFPPAPPSGLVALAEGGTTRLVWEASAARDIAGYLVFAARDAGEAVQLTAEPIARPEYVHTGTVSGATYTYTVAAVDTAGNRSRPSDAVSARVP